VLVAFSHVSLDFSSGWEHIDNFESETELCTQRMSEATLKMAKKSDNLHKWIICDELGRKFYSARSGECQKKETNLESTNKKTSRDDLKQENCKGTREGGKCDTRDNPSGSNTNEKPYVVEEEEEEVILFNSCKV